jgi:hypothetical protein
MSGNCPLAELCQTCWISINNPLPGLRERASLILMPGQEQMLWRRRRCLPFASVTLPDTSVNCRTEPSASAKKYAGVVPVYWAMRSLPYRKVCVPSACTCVKPLARASLESNEGFRAYLVMLIGRKQWKHPPPSPVLLVQL